MRIIAKDITDHLAALEPERAEVLERLRDTVRDNLPPGFEEELLYDMISFVVPLSRYPAGYHVDPSKPLGFISVAAQKRHFALYHSAVYADPELSKWFREAYEAAGIGKLDMGKSCIRFSSAKKIPWDLIAELCQKMTVDEYIELYENTIKDDRKRK